MGNGIPLINKAWETFEGLRQICEQDGHPIFGHGTDSPIPNDVKTACAAYAKVIEIMNTAVDSKRPSAKSGRNIHAAWQLFAIQALAVSDPDMRGQAEVLLSEVESVVAESDSEPSLRHG